MTDRTAGDDSPPSPTMDWGRDLDILDPRYVDDPFSVWHELRDACPVTMAREVIADVEVAGCPMRAGDKVAMALPAGNRDPAQFENHDDFILDGERNRHVAFGSAFIAASGPTSHGWS